MTTPVTLQSLATICVDNASKSLFFPTKIAWIRQAQNLVEQSLHEARPTFAGVLADYAGVVKGMAEALTLYATVQREQAQQKPNPSPP